MSTGMTWIVECISCTPCLYLGIICIMLTMLYRHLTRNFDYWSKRGIGGPTPIPIFGTMIYNFIGSKCVYERQWLRKYGKIYGLFRGSKPYLAVAEPTLVRDILVKDFNLFMNHRALRANTITNQALFRTDGQQWRRLRALMTPIFTLSKLRRMDKNMNECAKRMVNELRTIDSSEVDMKFQIAKFTTDVTSVCMFNITVPSTDLDHYVANLRRIFNYNPIYEMATTLLPLPVLRSLVMRFGSEANIGNEFFINIGRHLMSKMKEFDKKSLNLIQILMNSLNDINTNGSKYITSDEVVAQIWGSYAPNYVETSFTLSALIHQLAINDRIQTKLYEELKNGFNTDEDIDYEVLDRMPFLDAVISEAHRMFTTPIRVNRISDSDYPLGDTGITIEKGMIIEIPLHAIHYSEEYYANSDTFIPERFMGDNRDTILPYTYIPFGAGPRTCVGGKYADMQMKICLAQLIRAFRLYPTANTGTQLKIAKNTLMFEPGHVVIGLIERQ